jgi:hypothetical protein
MPLMASRCRRSGARFVGSDNEANTGQTSSTTLLDSATALCQRLVVSGCGGEAQHPRLYRHRSSVAKGQSGAGSPHREDCHRHRKRPQAPRAAVKAVVGFRRW